MAARIEASCNGLDIRYVVTNIARGSLEELRLDSGLEGGFTERLYRVRSDKRHQPP